MTLIYLQTHTSEYTLATGEVHFQGQALLQLNILSHAPKYIDLEADTKEKIWS